MLKSLWNNLQSGKSEAPAQQAVFDRDKLKLLVEHFPIGKKLSYFPEFLRDIVFQTFIIAYRVNGHFIYTNDEVVIDRAGFPVSFLTPAGRIAVGQLKTFQLLLPDTTDKERTLDYFTRAELGRAGQFRTGNTITLFVETVERGIPTMDTKVDRRQVMQGGPYDDSSTILVTPDFGSLVLADRRRRQRIDAALPANLWLTADGLPFQCLLGDFSERSLRLLVSEGNQIMPPMVPGYKVIVEFDLGEAAVLYRLQGKVFRSNEEFCVVEIEHIYKFGKFEKLKMMDIVEIKTGLLNLRG